MSDESKREASAEEKVIFDVGGKMYAVSRSLIEEHSDTMLARIVSKTWQEDPNSVVFIDRDGETFRFVLGKHIISRCKSHDIINSNDSYFLFSLYIRLLEVWKCGSSPQYANGKLHA